MESTQAQDALTIFHLTVANTATLAAHYLAFLRHGGLLVTHTTELALSAPVFLLLELPGQQEALACNGTIAMVHGRSKDGFVYGVHFSQESQAIKDLIQKLLGGKSRQGPDWQRWLSSG